MRWWVALVLVAGCSAIYGLDGVENDDADGDHIPKRSDNCPTVYNPDQSDVDGDGSGDACEVCGATDPTDSDGDGIPDQCDGCDNRLPDGNGNDVPDACEHPHDEDGDGVPDIHDNCPSVKNGDQLDAMDGGPSGGLAADGVGDACDDSPGIDRQIFDSFADESQLWVLAGPGWSIDSDQAVAPLTPTGAFRYAGFARGTFRIRTHVTLPSDGEVSVVVTNGMSPPAQVRVACSISVSTHQVLLTVDNIGTTGSASAMYTPPGPADDLILDGVPLATGGVTLTCSTSAGPAAKVPVMATVPTWTPGIGGLLDTTPTTSTPTMAFDYYDVVTSGL
jgi:hypothetical protein